MRNNRKLAGLLMLLLIGAIAFATCYRRDRTGEVSTSTSANSGVSSPIATAAGSGADNEGPMPAAPPVEPPGGGAAQGASGEASKPIRADGANTMRGGAQPKATGASKAKRQEAEPQKSVLAVAQGQGESSDGADAGSHPEPTPEVAPPPKEMGLLVGRIHNSVGSTFRLTQISFFVDGSQIAAQNYPSGIEPRADVRVFETRLDLGSHTLQVLVEYQGNSAGVFSYFEGYRYKISSSHEFTTTANTATQITVVTYEKGGLLTSFDKRLGVAFRVGTASSQ